jgi:hypothetical protein
VAKSRGMVAINRSLENLKVLLSCVGHVRSVKYLFSLVLGYVSSVADPGSETFLTSVVDPHHFDPDPDFFLCGSRCGSRLLNNADSCGSGCGSTTLFLTPGSEGSVKIFRVRSSKKIRIRDLG